MNKVFFFLGLGHHPITLNYDYQLNKYRYIIKKVFLFIVLARKTLTSKLLRLHLRICLEDGSTRTVRKIFYTI